jgi:hypothetical protein
VGWDWVDWVALLPSLVMAGAAVVRIFRDRSQSQEEAKRIEAIQAEIHRSWHPDPRRSWHPDRDQFQEGISVEGQALLKKVLTRGLQELPPATTQEKR